jgi:DNA-binding MarR family transcriptional regulator
MTNRTDFVHSLGILTIAHRLKRTMQRLLDESSELHAQMGLKIKPRWGSTLLLLEAEGPLAVTQVAERLRLSHPAVVQSLDDMADMGLVRRAKDPSDGRRSVLSLSAKGRRWMPKLHEVWGHLAHVQEEIFEAAGGDILRTLDRVEAQLNEEGLSHRVLQRLERPNKTNKPRSREKTA